MFLRENFPARFTSSCCLTLSHWQTHTRCATRAVYTHTLLLHPNVHSLFFSFQCTLWLTFLMNFLYVRLWRGACVCLRVRAHFGLVFFLFFFPNLCLFFLYSESLLKWGRHNLLLTCHCFTDNGCPTACASVTLCVHACMCVCARVHAHPYMRPPSISLSGEEKEKNWRAVGVDGYAGHLLLTHILTQRASAALLH